MDNLVKITDKMINFAEQGLWDDVVALQSERSGMYEQLERLFATGGIRFSTEVLTQLKERNDILLECSEKAREESKGSLQQVRGRKKASDAYNAK